MSLKDHTWQNSIGPILDMTQVHSEASFTAFVLLSVILQNARFVIRLLKDLNLNSTELYNYVTIPLQLLRDPSLLHHY